MSRNQYCDYALYLKKKQANHYFNLAVDLYTGSNTAAEYKNITTWLSVCLLFNKNDTDAKELLKKLCSNNNITQANLEQYKSDAKTIYNNCT